MADPTSIHSAFYCTRPWAASVPGRGTSVAAPPLHRLNPEVSVGLSDIIHKCLCADTRGRYPNAAALAGDLRRHLNHLPLVGVPNRSVLERIRKWRKRRPAALARQVFLLLSVVATIAAAVMLAGAYRERARELDETLTRSRADLAAGQFLQAENTLKHGLAVAGSSRAFVTWRRMYEDELRVALRNRKAAELHQLADIVRFRDGLAPQPSDDANALLKRGRELWHAHSLLLTPIPDRREPEIEQRIRTDLLDIVTVWAELRVQLSPDVDVAEARREALAQLDRAAALLGPGPRWNAFAAIMRKPSGSLPRPSIPPAGRSSRARPGSIATWVAPSSAIANLPAPPSTFNTPSIFGPRTSGPTFTRVCAPTGSAASKTPSTPSASASHWPITEPSATSTGHWPTRHWGELMTPCAITHMPSSATTGSLVPP